MSAKNPSTYRPLLQWGELWPSDAKAAEIHKAEPREEAAVGESLRTEWGAVHMQGELRKAGQEQPGHCKLKIPQSSQRSGSQSRSAPKRGEASLNTESFQQRPEKGHVFPAGLALG